MAHDHSTSGESDHRRLLSRRNVLQTAAIAAAATAIPGLHPPRARADVAPQTNGVDAFEGIVTDVTRNTVAVDVNGEERRLALTGAIPVWRGVDGGSDLIEVGDLLTARISTNGDFLRGWSNLRRLRGTVVDNSGGQIVFDTGVAKIPLSLLPQTRYFDDLSGAQTRKPDLPVGIWLDAIGLGDGERLVGTTISYMSPQAATTSSSGPDTVQSGPAAIPFNMNCIYTYTGKVTYFDCPTGAGRCGTCNTSNSAQCAWPALDAGCNSCTTSCCNCSSGCKNQVFTSCGHTVDVTDICASKTKTITIAECGPCQNGDGCSPNVCSQTCTLCGTTKTGVVVDLTRPTFSTFRNIANVTCFPGSVKIVIVQPTC